MRVSFMSMTSILGWAAVLGLLSAVAACGDDDPITPADTSEGLFDTSSQFPDTQVADDTTTPPDTAQPPQDTTTPQETSEPPDLIPDNTPPDVISTSPAHGESGVALPVTFSVVFSKPIFSNTVAPASVMLLDIDGQQIPGTPTLEDDLVTVTWVPQDADQRYASPYTIRLVGNIISDLRGNRMVETKEYTFTTEAYPDQAHYHDVAARYAPRVHSAVDGVEAPHAQVPVRFDADGDWNLHNNHAWLTQTATELSPAVYYNVAETFSHYFIQYMLYFPWNNHETQGYGHANHTIGYMVTVEKARGAEDERPIALHAFWREGTSEENYGFVTHESGIVAAGDSAATWWAHAAFSQADLFPEGRFQAFVTARSHRACLWGWEQSGAFAPCRFPAAVASGNRLVFAYTDGTSSPYAKDGTLWPADMALVDGAPEALGYELVPSLATLWPRRAERTPGQVFDHDTYNYTAASGRPGAGLVLTSKLADPLGVSVTAYGRPFWAYGYSPAQGTGADTSIARIDARGLMTVDPAWYIWRRHHTTTKENGLVAWDADTGEGFSVDYCFNGVAGLDVRATAPECQ